MDHFNNRIKRMVFAWRDASFANCLGTKVTSNISYLGTNMQSHVLDQLKAIETKCFTSDSDSPAQAYDLIRDLAYCVQVIAEEMPTESDLETIDIERERTRFEEWARSETAISNYDRDRLDPIGYERYETSLAWNAWLRSRTFGCE